METGAGGGMGPLVGLLLGRIVDDRVVGDIVGWVLGDKAPVLATHTAPLDKKSPGPPTAKKSPSSRDKAIENPAQVKNITLKKEKGAYFALRPILPWNILLPV